MAKYCDYGKKKPDFLKRKAGRELGLSWKSDLNRRPIDYESIALPTELFQQYILFMGRQKPVINTKQHIAKCLM